MAIPWEISAVAYPGVIWWLELLILVVVLASEEPSGGCQASGILLKEPMPGKERFVVLV